MEVAVETLTKRYAQFSGRAARLEYWMYLFFFLCAVLIHGIADQMFDHPAEPFVYAAGAFAVLLPGLALGFRRMHDLDRSAWWLAVGLIPVLGTAVVLWWFMQPGTEGANRFGPDPRARHAPIRFA